MKTKKTVKPELVTVKKEGSYTIVQAQRFTLVVLDKGGFVGEGVARRSNTDPIVPERGVNIAKSRAEKAWKKKVSRKNHQVHEMFQG